MANFPLIFERSRPGRRGARPPAPAEVDLAAMLGKEHLRHNEPRLPSASSAWGGRSCSAK